MKTKQINNLTQLTADNGFIHKIGTDDYYKSIIMLPNDTLDMYEEVSEKPLYTEAEYRAEVERLIALRYTTGQEIQFAREKESAGKAYEEYLAYVEECKVKAKEAERYNKADS